jgi:hypothetical protein
MHQSSAEADNVSENDWLKSVVIVPLSPSSASRFWYQQLSPTDKDKEVVPTRIRRATVIVSPETVNTYQAIELEESPTASVADFWTLLKDEECIEISDDENSTGTSDAEDVHQLQTGVSFVKSIAAVRIYFSTMLIVKLFF